MKVEQHDIERAVAALRSGALIALPTETVYGLGADAQNTVAARRIFAVKGRPSTHPLIDLSQGTPAILRPGGVPREDIEQLLGLAVADRLRRAASAGNAAMTARSDAWTRRDGVVRQEVRKQP